MAFDLKKAQEELNMKSLHQIQMETAYTWGSRAYVAYHNFVKTKKIDWYKDGLEYEHESLEHAALIEDKQSGILKEVQDRLRQIKKDADTIIAKKSFV